MSQNTIDLTQIVISGAVSLVAAFAGAYFAFKFQSQTMRKDIEGQNILAALEALFCLIRMVNHVGAFRKQFIEPTRSERLRHFSMPPMSEHTEEYQLNWSKLTFLLSSEHANVLNELSLTYTKFRTLENAISERSNIMLNVVQPRVEAAGIMSGEYYSTEEHIENLLGHRTYVSLKRITDDIVLFADESFDDIWESINNLKLSIQNIYPHAKLPNIGVES